MFKTFLLAAVLLCILGDFVIADVILGWDFSTLPGGANNFGPSPFGASSVDVNVSSVGLARGSGVTMSGTGAGNAWGGTDFQTSSSAAAVAANDFFSFSLTANAGSTMNISDIGAFNVRHSSSGANTGLFQFQVGAGAFTDIGTSFSLGTTISSAGNAISSINLNGISALQNVTGGTDVKFRLLLWGGTTSIGTAYLNDPSSSVANDFTLNGTITAVPEPTSLLSVASCMGLASAYRRRRIVGTRQIPRKYVPV